MRQFRKKLRTGNPNHRAKTKRYQATDRTKDDRETLDRWLTPDRLAIVTSTRFRDER